MAVGEAWSYLDCADKPSTGTTMIGQRCPYCGAKLGNFLYADMCPRCCEELKHNTKPLVAAKQSEKSRATHWPIRLLHWTVRLVEG
jgi:predicted amidophosphoribosyltransferase